MTEELEVLCKAFIDARALIGDVGGVRRKDTVAGVYDAVTDIDVAVERKVIGAIRSAFPDDAIIAEESSPDAIAEGRTWALDPIDGTVNMTRGIPLYGMQGVFMRDGAPEASAILLPESDELFTASSEGAFLNDIPVHVAEPRPLKECILTTGDFSRRSQDYRRMQALLLSECRDCVARFKMFGAACVDFAYLACGRTDIHVRFVNKIWDFMPGLYLAEKAGAVYDRDLLEKMGILILCSSEEVLDEALDEILPRISPSSSRRSAPSRREGTRAVSSRCSPRRS